MAEPAAAREVGAGRTLAVAFAVCGVCAAVVSAAVVALRPYQLAHQQRDRDAQVRALVAGLPGVSELAGSGTEVEVRAIELATGAAAPGVDPEALLRAPFELGPPGSPGPSDQERRPLPPERDVAGIGSVPRHAAVTLVRRGGRVDTVVLPVQGQGYLAMMRGYLAVAADGDTVRGITFVSHEETPGLGAEIENPCWQRRWVGKHLRDASGAVAIRVVRDPPAGPEADTQVQGISGATRTGDGVSRMVRFWVGPDGFGPFLERIRAEATATEGDAPS